MNTKLTDITVVLDRSGSMQSCKTDVEGGLSTFVKSQKEAKAADGGTRKFSLVQFDNIVETVFSGVDIDNAPEFTLTPRGGTALLDAVGSTVTSIGDRIAALPESERPGLVVVAIVTDGEENQSIKFTKEQIKTMISHQQNVYNWQFVFLGANQDAFKNAGSMGISASATANFAGACSAQAFSSLSSNVSSNYSARVRGVNEYQGFTQTQRTSMTTK